MGFIPLGYSNADLAQLAKDLIDNLGTTPVYQNPTISSLTSTLFGTYEVGQPLPNTPQTINYVVSNSANIKVQPPNIGVPSSTIPGATFTTNPFNLLAAGSYSINMPSVAFTSAVPSSYTVGLQGTNTNNVNFNNTGIISFKQRVYFGSDSNTSLTEPQVEALTNNPLRSGFAGTYFFGSGGYKWFCYPASMGTATTFTDTSNGFPVAMFGTVGLISVTNAFGVTENYRTHRTLNVLGGTINILIS